MAVLNLPTNPSTNSGEVGKDFLLSIATGVEGDDSARTYKWVLVGGQRNSALKLSADTIDVSHKTSGGWAASKAGLRSWSIDLDALYVLNDEGVAALEQAFMEGKEVYVKLEYPDKRTKAGWGSVTDFSLDVPHDGEAAVSGTISGNGPLEEIEVP